MTTVPAHDIREGDVVTMRDTFRVTEVTDTHIWAGPVAYTKASRFGEIVRTWDLFPVQP